MLTPFYDLMCTHVYPGLSGKFALASGGENRPGIIGREQVVRMAGDLDFRADFVLDIAERLAYRIEPALEEALAAVRPLLSHSGKVLAQKVQWRIHELTEQLSKRILDARRP